MSATINELLDKNDKLAREIAEIKQVCVLKFISSIYMFIVFIYLHKSFQTKVSIEQTKDESANDTLEEVWF